MASNIVTMPGISPPTTDEPNEPMIRALTDILELARSGKLQHVLMIGSTCDGLRMTYLMDWPDLYQCMGSIEMLKQEYIERYHGDGP